MIAISGHRHVVPEVGALERIRILRDAHVDAVHGDVYGDKYRRILRQVERSAAGRTTTIGRGRIEHSSVGEFYFERDNDGRNVGSPGAMVERTAANHRTRIYVTIERRGNVVIP